MRTKLLFAAMLATSALPAHAAITFAGALTVAGEATDLSGFTSAGALNRLSFGSDLTYDSGTDTYYGITDRGPGGGVYEYAPRVNTFKLDINPTSGAASNFVLQSTVVLKQANGQPYDGQNPLLLNGSVSTLGASLDTEGLVRRANGNLLVSDEYGPSVIEFTATGDYIRTFTVPNNLLPRAGSTLDYVNGRGTITTGRQDNRGFEGLTLSPDGKTAYAILQDPLINEGNSSEGRRGLNLRIVKYDVATGTSTGQYVYQLETVASINGRIPGTVNDFGATAQGRNIGVSSITALGNGKFLVIERDNRGFGEADPTGATVVGSKRVYMIDLTGATDVSAISLAGTNTLPSGVVPVSKSLFLDIQAALVAAGVTVAEKIEGLSFGPRLPGGGISLLLATDKDFSVTQNASLTQLDVCTSGVGGTFTLNTFTVPCANPGESLIPTYVYSFAVTGADALAVGVPEPDSWALMIAGFGLIGGALRSRRKLAHA